MTSYDMDEIAITIDIGVCASIFAIVKSYNFGERDLFWQAMRERLKSQGFNDEIIDKTIDKFVGICAILESGIGK